jgi:hypothetical protein
MGKFREFLLTIFCIFSFCLGMSDVAMAFTQGDGSADFFAQVLAVASTIGGLGLFAKISAVIMLLVASLKVGVFRQAVWSKLGWAQVLVAPALGLLAGILGLGAGGAAITPALVFAYVVAGGGAVFLHELLDAIKSVPGIGPVYLAAIDTISRALEGSTAQRGL